MEHRVVFTGPAFNNAGQSIVRHNLIEACEKAGDLVVQSSVRPDTTMVVASRKDTVKARRAAENGLPVLTYPEFITRYLAGVELVEGGVPNRYTDKIDLDSLVPDFVGEIELL